jgi:hypothetical protein
LSQIKPENAGLAVAAAAVFGGMRVQLRDPRLIDV